uniref:Lysozyme g n=1 Tax=Salarias fasciatus TaxID=181472 RepID=A0A672FM39_SALFA
LGYGDITKVHTDGASKETAQAEKLEYSGVRASEKMAATDLEDMDQYKDMIKKVGRDLEIQPALIAGIISRESRAGTQLKNGWGDNGKAWGLMQVDVTPNGGRHKPEGDWDSEEHLRQATRILIGFIEKIQQKFPHWSKEEQLKGGIAAYNMGDGNVEDRNVDKKTTGKDYANDVVARAQWYKKNGYDTDSSLCLQCLI